MPKGPLTREKLEEILRKRDMDQLIGYAENGFFEAKRSCYNLQDPKEKHELCKDITAFANNEGGFLIIGCGTEKPENKFLEYIKDALGITDFLDMDAVGSVLTEFVYPPTIGTLLGFEQITTEDGRKFLLITVSNGAAEKPYFVKRASQDREFIAYYQRTNDRAIVQSVGYIHELIRQGLQFDQHLKSVAGATEKTLANTEKLLKRGSGSGTSGMRYDIKKDL